MAELRRALRALSQSRWYAGTIIAVMALCVSLATTVFAVVDGVLFKPLPYPRSGELYLMTGGFQTGQRNNISIAPRNIRDWTAAVPGAVSATINSGQRPAPTGDVREWVPVIAGVDEQFFDVLGISPLVGGFTAADFIERQPATVLISYGVWQSKFGGRADVVGQSLEVTDGVGTRQRTVAGVLPRDFLYPWRSVPPDLLEPLVPDPARRDDLRYRFFNAVTRLPAGVSFDEAQARMDAAAAAEESDWIPRASDGTGFFDHASLQPLESVLSWGPRPVFQLAATAAGLLMLLGCLNISGLMASRAFDRRRDTSVRRALGGRAVDIARPLFLENLVVIGLGAGLGAVLAAPLLRVTLNLLPASLALLKTPAIDARVAVFAVLAAVASTLIASAWPVRRAVRLPAIPALAEGAAGSHRVLSAGRFVVVAGQVAIGLALTLSGALLVGSLLQVRSIDPGYDADRVIVMVGRAIPGDRAERNRAIERFMDELGTLPGVTAVGATQSPFTFGNLMHAFMDGYTVPVTPGFYETMGLRLSAGRWMTDEELTTGVPVVVLTERAARKVFGEDAAVGRQIRGFVAQQPRSFEVVGVVEDVNLAAWDEDQMGQIFGPYSLTSDDQSQISLVIRTAAPDQLMPTLLTLVRTPDLGDVSITIMAKSAVLLNESIRPRRMHSWVFGGFATASLVIIGVGVLGLIAMSSAQRTREIGIRLALGSTSAGIVRLLVREQMSAVLAGLLTGGLVSAWAVKFLRAYLFQVDVGDPAIWGVACGVVLAVALIGTVIPSVRASRLDPSRALQTE